MSSTQIHRVSPAVNGNLFTHRKVGHDLGRTFRRKQAIEFGILFQNLSR